MELASDTLARIFSAADSLFEEAGQSGFPTVDAVRKSARVNMNDASAGMKEWRRLHTLQAAPAPTQVPDDVRHASAMALSVLWRDAQRVADDNFRAARAGWDAERAENEILHQQLADAFEAQATELGAAADAISRLEAEIASLRIDKTRFDEQVKATARDLASARAAVEVGEARVDELTRSNGDLRKELDHAHQESARLQNELEHLGRNWATEMEEVRQASTRVLAQADAECKAAVQGASKARKLAATLRGKLDAAKEQNVALLHLVAASKPS